MRISDGRSDVCSSDLKARGATAYATREPCAHESPGGPGCSSLLIEAGVARVAIALGDPDPRTNGAGIARLEAAGITVARDVLAKEARAAMAGFLTRQTLGSTGERRVGDGGARQGRSRWWPVH